MPNGITVGAGGASKQVSSIAVGIDGTPKNVSEVYAGVNGVPKLVWSAVTGNRLFGYIKDILRICEINKIDGTIIKQGSESRYFSNIGGCGKRLFAVDNQNTNVSYCLEVNVDTLAQISRSEAGHKLVFSYIGGVSNDLFGMRREYVSSIGYPILFWNINTQNFSTTKLDYYFQRYKNPNDLNIDGTADSKLYMATTVDNSSSDEPSNWVNSCHRIEVVSPFVLQDKKIDSNIKAVSIGGTTDEVFGIYIYHTYQYYLTKINTETCVEISYLRTPYFMQLGGTK